MTHRLPHERAPELDLESLGLLLKGKQGNAYVFFSPPDLRARLQMQSADAR
ncbi:MAG: hypothetical protein JWN23_521 [Rhodocyclales bacterium]|nr:hypothetical protein [Rhodocyclales bacterium]